MLTSSQDAKVQKYCELMSVPGRGALHIAYQFQESILITSPISAEFPKAARRLCTNPAARVLQVFLTLAGAQS